MKIEKQKVSILTHSFLDGYNQDFSRIFGGGLERYIYDLCGLIKELGYIAEVHQLSFFKEFHNVVEGIEVFGHPYDFDKIPEAFEQMADKAEGKLIYASCIWHPIRYRQGSLGICHGINWDRHDLPVENKQYVSRSIQNALDHLSRIVSVDSHFVTFCRSVCHFSDPEKIITIPNAVDTGYFVPKRDNKKAGKPLRILYPRRISYERGIIPMMLVTDRILSEYPDIIVEFAGELVQATTIGDSFQLWRQAHPQQDRIIQNRYSFQEIIEAYQRSDIVIIPTIFSEGTSYSCLEAMSCGLPVLSSNVGGLNDLITDGYNGLLVLPVEEHFYRAVQKLIGDRRLRKELGKKARSTSFSFDLSIWKQRWRMVLAEYLQ